MTTCPNLLHPYRPGNCLEFLEADLGAKRYITAVCSIRWSHTLRAMQKMVPSQKTNLPHLEVSYFPHLAGTCGQPTCLP